MPLPFLKRYRTGFIAGTATPVSPSNYSVIFNGTNHFINCGAFNEIEGSTAITINVRFKAGTLSHRGSLASKYHGSGQRTFTFDINTNGSLRFLKMASAASGSDYVSTTTTDTGFNDGAWHMATVTWEPGTTKIYIDGVEKTTSEVVGGTGDGSDIQATTSNFYIGAAEFVSTTPDFLFEGSIFDTAVWDEALAANELTSIYNNVSADLGSNIGDYTSSGNLIGYWKLDEGEGVIASDSSVNSNDGTLTNGPTWSTDIPT